MSESSNGVCSTCELSASCLYRATAGRPVVHCEEKILRAVSVGGSSSDLCPTCDYGRDCVYHAVTAGPVRYCEEYVASSFFAPVTAESVSPVRRDDRVASEEVVVAAP